MKTYEYRVKFDRSLRGGDGGATRSRLMLRYRSTPVLTSGWQVVDEVA
jgi:hypothetical protein